MASNDLENYLVGFRNRSTRFNIPTTFGLNVVSHQEGHPYYGDDWSIYVVRGTADNIHSLVLYLNTHIPPTQGFFVHTETPYFGAEV